MLEFSEKNPKNAQASCSGQKRQETIIFDFLKRHYVPLKELPGNPAQPIAPDPRVDTPIGQENFLAIQCPGKSRTRQLPCP